MKHMLLILFAFAATALAQTNTTGTISSGSGSISTSWISNQALWCNPQGNCSLMSGGGNWGSVETRSASAKAVTLNQVKESAAPITNSRLAPAGYRKLAREINLDSPALEEAAMLEFLHKHEISVYDYDKVDNYLYHQALAQGANMRWVWEPLRDVDRERSIDGSSRFVTGMGIVYAKKYARAVPQRILERVATVIKDSEADRAECGECFGLSEQPIFLISDYEVQRPDPFLAISTANLLQQGKIFIIDCWDEPGFTEKAKPVPAPKRQTPIPAPEIIGSASAAALIGRGLFK